MFLALNKLVGRFSVLSRPLPVVVKNQYIYKLKANSGYFCGLIVIQLIAALFSIGGTTSSSIGGGYISVTFHIFSELIIMFFCVSWSFVIGAVLTTQNLKRIAFSIPCNRLSDCFSDVAYILTGCLFGGITTALLGVALRIPIYFLDFGKIVSTGFYPSFLIITGVAVVTMLYMLIAASIAYFAGVLVQLNRVFIMVIPALIFGTLISQNTLPEVQIVISNAWSFFVSEKSIGLLMLKDIGLAAILFALGTIVSKRLEVRK